MPRPIPVLLALLALPPLALAAAPRADVAEALRVGAVLDGETLRLEDGRELRLAGIRVPRVPSDRPADAARRYAERARALLGKLVLGRELRLAFAGGRRDRHGRVLAHAYGPDEVWLQGALLTAGLARVDSRVDDRTLVAEMLALEGAARAAGRGLWRSRRYAVRQAEDVGRHIASFQLVEGRVRAVAVVRGRAFLNFGDDWREDFTVSLVPEVRRRFESEGVDPRSYRGKRIRVRGWVASWNGALIEATHPEQIELLND